MCFDFVVGSLYESYYFFLMVMYWNICFFFLKCFNVLFVDIDECNENFYNCYELVICINIVGFYVCVCDDGYMGSGELCCGMCVIF